tara:strand:- start:1796 stop:2623 length:828 start_codon:yes stop_codon:yes gene_type:complete
MKTRVATIILNRNLGIITDNLYKKIYKYNRKYTDIFVIDSGSDAKKKSKYTTWSANWKKAKQNGLRFSRGMNYGLLKMYQENKFKNYEYFLLLTNDSEVESKPFIKELVSIMNKVKSIAILSPCSKKWGEKILLKDKKLKFFWYIHNNAYFVRKDFIELVRKKKNFNYFNFLFDGKNFRGFGADSELIMKAYKNNMSAAITSKVWIEENENYLLKKSNLIKTDPYDRNLKLYINEGLKWIKRRYNFDSRWDLHLHVKKYYNIFFEKNKKLLKYKI